MNNKESEVIDFLSNFLSIKKDEIKLDSSILFDFGVTGDDGEDLIKTFSEKFSVDISEFNSELHFGSEGFLSFFRKIQRELKVYDLINAAKSGYLKNKEII